MLPAICHALYAFERDAVRVTTPEIVQSETGRACELQQHCHTTKTSSNIKIVLVLPFLGMRVVYNDTTGFVRNQSLVETLLAVIMSITDLASLILIHPILNKVIIRTTDYRRLVGCWNNRGVCHRRFVLKLKFEIADPVGRKR